MQMVDWPQENRGEKELLYWCYFLDCLNILRFAPIWGFLMVNGKQKGTPKRTSEFSKDCQMFTFSEPAKPAAMVIGSIQSINSTQPRQWDSALPVFTINQRASRGFLNSTQPQMCSWVLSPLGSFSAVQDRRIPPQHHPAETWSKVGWEESEQDPTDVFEPSILEILVDIFHPNSAASADLPVLVELDLSCHSCHWNIGH